MAKNHSVFQNSKEWSGKLKMNSQRIKYGVKYGVLKYGV